MPRKILYIERKYWGFVSIEKVFEQISKFLSKEQFESSFTKVKYDNSLAGIIKNLLLFKKPPADIYHVTGHIHYLALILPRNRTVLTIHDLGFLHIRRGLRKYVIKKLFLDLPVRKLKYITAITESTRNEIIAYSNCSPEKIRIIENPIQDQYLTSSTKHFNSENPLILQVGTLPNKNVINLIKALKGIKCRLRLVGKLNAEILEALAENDIFYENAFELDDAAMKTEYQNADLVAFCSTYEGFGLPIIESQAMQTPVITSNISPMREVSGNAAYLANPSDIEDIRLGIIKIINDEDFRQRIISDGVKNVERFSPNKIADQYALLYEEILEVNK